MRGYISLDKYPSCINSHIKNTPLLLGEDEELSEAMSLHKYPRRCINKTSSVENTRPLLARLS